jgi:GH24 family phage-related lysozyme (muramidase)/uncharacterized protein (DUF2345 family)
MVTLATQRTHSSPANRMDAEGRRTSFDKIYLGFVRDFRDSMFMGRLKVWIPELCGPDIENTYITCDYVTPFGGSVGNTSYGMWALPQRDAQVIVSFINGDPNRAVWMGCIYGVDEHRQVPNARTGSHTSREEINKNDPGSNTIPPGATVVTSAREEAELLTDSGDQAVPSITTTPPSRPQSDPDERISDLAESAGTINPATRPTDRGSDNSYHVLGIRTPGGHGFTLSDQQGAAEIRLQTFNNMQIILDSQSGNITIITGEAKSRIEVNADGNINLWGQGSLNIVAEENLNLHARKNVNINAGEKFNWRAGGSIHVESIQDMNFRSNTNIKHTSRGEQHRFSIGNIFDTTAQSFFRRSNYGIRDSVTQGDINLKTFGGNILATAVAGNLEFKSDDNINVQASTGSINVRAGDLINCMATSDINILSTSGDMNMTSVANMNLRSNTGNMLLTSVAGLLQLKAAGVYVDPVFNINTGAGQTAEPASEAEQAQSAIGAESAFSAVGPEVYSHPSPGPRPGTSTASGGAGSRGSVAGNNVITSTTPLLPSGETSANRYQSGPGFSNTDTVTNSSGYGENFLVGQVAPNQRVPLQVIGYVDPSSGSRVTQESISGRGDFTWQMRLAVSAMESRYNLRPTPRGAYRSDSYGSQHRHTGEGESNAADFSLRGLPQSTKQQIINDILNSIRSGTGAFRYIRGMGTYDVNADLLHIDARQGSSLLVWGANGRAALNGSSDFRVTTPAWFQSLVLPGGNYVQAATQVQAPQTTTARDTPNDSTGTTPKRYIGIGYVDGKPEYVIEDIPNGLMKKASDYVGEYDGLSASGFESIRNFETLKGPWPTDISGRVFRNACATPSSDIANQPPSGGIQLIGYAHRLTDQELADGAVQVEGIPIAFDAFTEEQAVKLLKQDLKAVTSAIKSEIVNEITQQQFDALVDFAWNIGVDKFLRNSGIPELIADKKYDRVPKAMISWVDACGFRRAVLVSRRVFNAHRWSGLLRADSPVLITGPQGEASGADRNLFSNGNVQIAYNYFISKGLSPAAAAGIVGNLSVEAPGLIPSTASAGAVGIAQWRGVRQQRLAQFLGVPNLQTASLTQQLDAIMYEFTNANPQTRDGDAQRAYLLLQGNVSTSQATDIFNTYYERSESGQALRNGRALTESEIRDRNRRLNNAQAIYNRFL